MNLRFEDGSVATRLSFEDGDEACVAYFEDGHDPVYEKPGLANAPTIENYGASSGSGNHKVLTLNATQLPIDITVTGNLTNVDRWTVTRIASGSSTPVSAGRNQNVGSGRVDYQEALSSQFKPDSQGWTYALLAENTTLAACGNRHASCSVRLVTGPTLASFTTSDVVSTQTPSGLFKRSYLNWAMTLGDPEGTATLTQVGTRHISHLPSSSRLTVANGVATGSHRQFVQTSGTEGGYTDLTLTVTGEGGSVSRTSRIVW